MTNSSELPLTEHLRELRERLIRCLIYISIGAVISYVFIDSITVFLFNPLSRTLGAENFIFKAVHEAFYIYFKLSIVCGIIFTSPLWIYEIWRFISPGLYLYEQRFVKLLFFVSGFFFVFGALFGYFFLLPPVINFLINYGGGDLVFLPSLNEYYSLIIRSLIGFGIAFQIPVFISLLRFLDIVSLSNLKKIRKYAIMIVLVISAFLTPTPDIVNQCLLAIPLYLLFELSIFIVFLVEKLKK